MSGGWTPTVKLFSQSRGKLIYRESDATFIPHKSFQEEISIGSCNGTFELEKIFEETYNKMTKLLVDFEAEPSPDVFFLHFLCRILYFPF